MQPGTDDYYWERNGDDVLGDRGFVKKAYPTGNQFAPDTSTQYSCAIEAIDGLPSGSPFWTAPPLETKGWGSFGKDLNFLINCTSPTGDAPPHDMVDWPNIIKELGGYNNVPTAGKVGTKSVAGRVPIPRQSHAPAGDAAGAHQPGQYTDGQ